MWIVSGWGGMGLLLLLFALPLVLGAFFFRLLAWEQQFVTNRPVWLRQLREGSQQMRLLRQRAEKAEALLANSPLALSPIKIWKTGWLAFKTFRKITPLRFF